MTEHKLTKKDCIVLLQEKHELLKSQGLCRYPQRSDFSDREVVAIKAFLGPWPRALEEAGIKPPRDDDHKQKNKEKRARAKRARITALKQIKEEQKNQAAKKGGENLQ